MNTKEKETIMVLLWMLNYRPANHADGIHEILINHVVKENHHFVTEDINYSPINWKSNLQQVEGPLGT